MRHWIRAVLSVRRVEFIRVLLLVCCGGPALAASAGELLPVRIGLTRDASVAPVLIAIDAGYFERAGLDPKLVPFTSDASVSAAVSSGKVDIGIAALSAPFFREAADHHLKIIASRSSDRTGFPMYVLLVSQKARAAGLSGVRGLPNANIGVASADSSEYYGLYSIATRFNLDPSSIKTILLKSSAGELSALSRGEIGAALLPYPAALALATQGRSLLRLSDFAQWQQGVVFVTAENIARRRPLIEEFMHAYQHGTAEYALNFLNYDDGGDFIPGTHYDRYLDLVARWLKVPRDTLARTKTYTDRRANLDVTDIEKQVQFWKDRDRLDQAVAAGDLLDLSFIGEESGAL
jgi:ABC-type nitrate/sulfonate/bicarbonate transport system substrate-binding protein